MQSRTSKRSRSTAETKIELSLNLDGEGNSRISTGVGFFDHMLTLFSRHSLIDLELDAEGDLEHEEGRLLGGGAEAHHHQLVAVVLLLAHEVAVDAES
ncbi:MAG: hypothetical protein ACPG4K_08250, partial [Haloferula sp.]